MNHLWLAAKFSKPTARILVIDDNQIHFDALLAIFKNQSFHIEAKLSDDLQVIQKYLKSPCDLIIFGQAYDFDLQTVVGTLHSLSIVDLPILLILNNHKETQNIDASHHAFQHIQYGFYDVIDIQNIESAQINILRALLYSDAIYLRQNSLNELETAQQKTQALVEEQKRAIAIIQEGIVLDSNTEFVELFGLKSSYDAFGMPILDILKPADVNEFKTRFRRISEGLFNHGKFELNSQNPILKSDLLKIECLAGQHDHEIQMSIDVVDQNDPALDKKLNQIETHSPFKALYDQIQSFLQQHPAQQNAFIVFSLANCPSHILNSNWKILTSYFSKLSDFIEYQTNGTAFKIDASFYATILQADNLAKLNSRLTALLSLEKPQLVYIEGESYPLNIRIGYHYFDATTFELNSFDRFIEHAYNTRLTEIIQADHQIEATIEEIQDIHFGATHPNTYSKNTAKFLFDFGEAISDEDEVHNPQSELLSSLRTALDRDEILLKYQQIYDKDDQSLNSYEVTSGFIYQNRWVYLADLPELSSEPELSIKIDRWVLVEASKQLHNFLTQFPEAKMIINLNHHIFLSYPQLAELVSKLLTIINASSPRPLILQFSEDKILENLDMSAEAILLLRAYGAELSIRNFGLHSDYEKILHQVDIDNLSLAPALTAEINQEEQLMLLQEKISHIKQIKKCHLLLKNLNDMNDFANAWKVKARFLQGNYFSKALDHLTDAQR